MLSHKTNAVDKKYWLVRFAVEGEKRRTYKSEAAKRGLTIAKMFEHAADAYIKQNRVVSR